MGDRSDDDYEKHINKKWNKKPLNGEDESSSV